MHWYLSALAPALCGPESEVLEVGPSRVAMRSHLAVLGAPNYTAIDTRRLAFHGVLPKPHRFLRMDVTRMSFSDASFDLILCCNVLPYVRAYRAALSELCRCLKPHAVALLNTPMAATATRTVHEYRAEHPRLDDEYFAENGDQWVFGRDLLVEVEEAGLLVRCAMPFAGSSEETLLAHGLNADSEFVLAARSAAGLDIAMRASAALQRIGTDGAASASEP